MALNLLDPALPFNTSITADCPCHADYTAEQLSLPTSKGFLSASFKKPPVTIFITFTDPSAIDLQKIVFRPRILSQCSTGAALSFLRWSSYPNSAKWTFWMRAEWSSEMDYVVLETMHYRPHGILPKEACKDFRPLPSMRIKQINLPRHGASSEIAALAITISHTHQSTSVAMKNLQIFGQPCIKIPREEYKALADVLRKPVVEVRNAATSTGVLAKALPSTPSTSKKLTIPEEFLDPLTCLIILDPVTLPSGITVDLSTLQKHENAQAEFGRNLFDPYTGKRLQYQELRANLHLRQRILDFLTANRKAVLEESSEGERTRLTNFLKSREDSGPAVPEPAPPAAHEAVECRFCRECVSKDAAYEYRCGAVMCRDCAVRRSFGNLAAEPCVFCRRVHSSQDITRFSQFSTR
ncbi:uncharacterized protein LOC129582702 [Paramacrobiotus metropolitanus]|uniref:uncharacterized protein LOC129582702 n=1 Tax=Paramacrobiotus metropolitanus TaxID=2943436 RepID=UPI002445EB89|nr:uncharacterized protein LOC129582702 [Paramacrobiotus metropolitanus]